MPQAMNFPKATEVAIWVCEQRSNKTLGFNSQGGPRGLQGHAFFTDIDWKLLKKGRFPPPFLLANYTQTKDATEAYVTARQLGFGTKELGHVRNGIQFQATNTPQTTVESSISTPIDVNLSAQMLDQSSEMEVTSMEKDSGNTLSGINIRQTDHHAESRLIGTHQLCHLCHQQHRQWKDSYCIFCEVSDLMAILPDIPTGCDEATREY